MSPARRQLAAATDWAAGTLLAVIGLAAVAPAGAVPTLTFLIKLILPVTAVLFLVRGAIGHGPAAGG